MKHLKTFFACMLMTVLSIGQVWATEGSVVLSAGSHDGTNITWVAAGSKITIMQTKGTSNTAVNASYISAPRVYKGHILSFAASDGYKINKIEITCSGAYYGNSMTAGTAVSNNTVTDNTTDIDKTWTTTSGGTHVVSAKDAAGLTNIYIQNVASSTNTQLRFTALKITYTAPSGGVAVSSVSLDETSITLDVDGTQELTATVLPDNATNKGVTWESSDANVATVANGVVTAVGAGDATITCKSAEDATKYATCAVHVNASLYTKSTLNFTQKYAEGGATADDDAEWTVTSDGTESAYDATKGIHYGTGSAAVQYIKLSTSDISGIIEKVVVNASAASGVSATVSVTVDGEAFGGDAKSIDATATDYTFDGSASGEIVVTITKESSATKALYCKSIVVTYIADNKESAGLAYNEADLKKLTKLGDVFTAPTLTNPHSLSVSYESSNTAVAEVASDGAVTIKAVGSTEITASFAGNDDYKAGSAKYTIGVVGHVGTKDDPYTVADAKVVIDALGGKENVYVAGIVSEANLSQDNIDQYHDATYWISDNGSDKALEAYHGKYIDNTDITSVDAILVGDEVVIYGNLTKYNSTYEFTEGNYLISLTRNKEAAGLSYEVTSVEKNINADEFTNPLTNPNNLIVTYSSSNENLAIIDENGVVLVGDVEGTVTITASTEGDATHLSGSATYTITISDPSLTKVTFDATVDTESFEKNNISMECTNGVLDNASEYRFYKNSELTFTCSTGNISRIEFTGVSGNPISGFGSMTGLVTNGNNGVWTGNAASVTFTASGAQVRATKIVVSYKADNREDAGLSWSAESVELTAGGEFTAPTLQNPNNIAAAEISITSDNTNLAAVNAGVVSLVENATGIAIITATFNGNDDYKSATVSYTITVNEAGLDNVTFDATQDVAGTNELSITKEGFTLTFTDGAMGNGSEYRLYKNQTMTLSSTSYLIKKIEFTCTSGNPISGFADAEGLDKNNSQWTGEANSVELIASGAQVRIEKLVVYYVDDTRDAAGLSWSADKVEITLGDVFTAATLVNPNNIAASEITIESDNTNLATISEGAVSLVADATGTAHITATFAGNDTYKPASVSYLIKINDPTPAIITNPNTYLNFGTVEQDATINAKDLAVTLQNVTAATVAISGEGAAAFSVDENALIADATLHVSASSANVGTFSATLTISDNAGVAEAKNISLSLTVTEAEVPETAVSTTSEWVVATDADLINGKEVLITGVKDDVTYAMGVQNESNRATVAGTLVEDIFTPGANTMSFTLVAQGDGTFALRTSDGKYLYAAASGKNQLKTQAEVDVNAKWTLSATSAVAESSKNRNQLKFNATNNPKIFSCYASGQTDILFYVPKPAPVATKYTVTYAAGEGTGDDIAAGEYEATQTFEVAANTFTAPEGKEFDKWNDGTNDYAPGATYTVGTSNVTLTAIWKDAQSGEPELVWAEGVRTGLTSGFYYTMCLDKAVTHVRGASIWRVLSKAQNNKDIILEEVTGTLEAGRPYFFYAMAATMDVVYTGDEVDAPLTEGNNGLVGSFAKEIIAQSENNFILYNNMLYFVNSTAYVGANRAYLNMADVPAYSEGTPAPGRRRVTMQTNGEQVATGMDEVNVNSEVAVKTLIDGQLFILRGQKKYDTTGRLVK